MSKMRIVKDKIVLVEGKFHLMKTRQVFLILKAFSRRHTNVYPIEVIIKCLGVVKYINKILGFHGYEFLLTLFYMEQSIKKITNIHSTFFETLYVSSAMIVHKFTQDAPYSNKTLIAMMARDSKIVFDKETIELMNNNQIKLMETLDWSIHDTLYQKKFHDFCSDVYLSNSFSPYI
ncbi:Uncharacterised protein [uncultured archaeon]|nr:Uncharacterised protein [uncultured archaeon]